jgi:hypothetical protein
MRSQEPGVKNSGGKGLLVSGGASPTANLAELLTKREERQNYLLGSDIGGHSATPGPESPTPTPNS